MTPAALVTEVLIVEDDASTRDLLAAIVSRNRYRPVLAADGRSGMALLSTGNFAAVILDLILPEMSGLAILAALASARPELLPRVLVVTAALEPEYADSAEVKSAGAFVAKPFEISTMERALLHCCAE